LAGWFIPGTNGATVILAHGMGSERSWMLSHANYLHKDGFSVLLFDFRYRGEHEGDDFTGGAKERWDIEGAVDYLKTRSDVDPDRIGAQGSSAGAASAILAAAETPEIKGVVAQIPFNSVSGILNHIFPILTGLPSFPFAPVTRLVCEFRLGVDLDDIAPDKVIAKISPRPVFLIDEGKDHLFPYDSVEVLYNLAREPKQFWSVPGAKHGKAWETAPEEYERQVLAFWRKALGIIQPESEK
ncbi:MAG: alpha/beta hydrolase, partial [Terriglobia bacterium]